MDEIIQGHPQNQVNSKTLEQSQATLLSFAKNKDFFRLNQYRILHGQSVFENYQFRNERRSYFSECTICDANFTSTGFTGSFFWKTKFLKVLLENTILDACNFNECEFGSKQELKMNGCSFRQSIFVNCTFTNVSFDSCFMPEAIFEGVQFIDCKFTSVQWEEAVFRHTTFENCMFKGLNFEFCQWVESHFLDVRLPLPTIPYIINGVSYIKQTADHFSISSARHPNGIMTKEEYLTLLPDLENFYRGTQNYFPLANILIALEKHDEAYTAILHGIKTAIRLHSYRTIKNFCVLMNTMSNLSQSHYTQTYKILQQEIESLSMNPVEYYTVVQYLGEARRLLIEKQSGTSVEITIKTQIPASDYQCLGYLLKTLDDLTEDYEENFRFEVRHFSPFEIFAQITSTPQNVISIIGITYSVFLGLDKLYDKVQKYRLNRLTAKQQIAQTQLLEAQKKNMEVDTQLKELQLAQQQEQEKILHARRFLEEKGVIIASVSHNIVSNEILNLDTMLQSHSEHRAR